MKEHEKIIGKIKGVTDVGKLSKLVPRIPTYPLKRWACEQLEEEPMKNIIAALVILSRTDDPEWVVNNMFPQIKDVLGDLKENQTDKDIKCLADSVLERVSLKRSLVAAE